MIKYYYNYKKYSLNIIIILYIILNYNLFDKLLIYIKFFYFFFINFLLKFFFIQKFPD